MKATKENAFSLISEYYDNVTKGEIYKECSDEFYAFEMIAKGYAMLSVIRDNRLSKNQKTEMYKFIREI